MGFITDFDIAALRFLSSIPKPFFLTLFMQAITALGNDGLIWILTAFICMLRRKTRACGISILVALILCLLLGNILIKPIIARPRPFTSYPDILPLISPPKDFSFPSGHTLSSFASAVVIFRFCKRAGMFSLLLAVLIAVSRVYINVHYPSDVVTGIILGIIIGVIATGLTKYSAKRIHYKNLRRSL